MKRLFHSILAASRKRRNFVVASALWLLRLVRDVEEGEMRRFESKLISFDSDPKRVSKREYETVEDECSICEYALGALDYAIDDLAYAYDEMF